MNLREFKSKFKRVIRYKGLTRYKLQKNRLIRDQSSVIFYICECGCNTYSNNDLWMVGKKPMTLECAIKRLEIK